jgi:Zn-dependent M16 (insulinase) family peptidase
MKALPQHLLPLLPLFCRSLTQMGTDKESFIELTERIGRKTGGLSFSTFISSVKGKQEPVAKFMVREEHVSYFMHYHVHIPCRCLVVRQPSLFCILAPYMKT